VKALDFIANKFGYSRHKPSRIQRDKVAMRIRGMAFAASEVNRLTEDWPTSILSSTASLGHRLRVMRARSRVLEQDNVYVRGFVKALKRNVLGAEGIKLEMRTRDPNGELDKRANEIIETAWRDWCDNYCDVSGVVSWKGILDLALGRTAIDGEGLIEFIDTQNPYRFGVRFLEADHLDELYNRDVDETRKIRMSVETDSFDRRLAYHILENHPGENELAFKKNAGRRRVVLAPSMVHSFITERSSQYRGVPWLHAAMMELKMLGGYKEAELVAARVAAAKAGFIKKSLPDGGAYTESENKRQLEVEPGIIEELEIGEDFVPWDPTHPNAAFGDFVKAALRGVSTGLGISYNTLSSDLEGVNFSSIRAGVLEEREEWIQIQKWMAQKVCRPIFRAWLKSALTYGAINLPIIKLPKFYADTWCGRRWSWVDPEKEINAALKAVEGGLRTRTSVIAESYGEEFENVLEGLKNEKDAADEAGVQLMGSNGSPLVVNTPFTQSQQDKAQMDSEEDGKKANKAAGTTDDIQTTALNGAQVQALQAIVQAVADGLLPKESAIGMIEIAFPDIDKGTISKIIAAAEKFEPERPETEPVAKPTEEPENETDE